MKKTLSVLGIFVLSTVLLTGCGSGKEKDSTNSTDKDNNQSVYKTIDFSSYSGDANSTEFDDLVNKKVTFTNVVSFAGYLGNMTKEVSCSNESSYEIEDDATYTVTGVVTSTIGTYSVNMKDCTITKN